MMSINEFLCSLLRRIAELYIRGVSSKYLHSDFKPQLTSMMCYKANQIQFCNEVGERLIIQHYFFSFRFFVFGGFGPARSLRQMHDAGVNFVRDDVYYSGWIDQLVYYDISKNFIENVELVKNHITLRNCTVLCMLYCFGSFLK